MIIGISLIAVVLVTAAAAVLLVSAASRREASAGTLSGPAPTWARAGARRVLGFYSRGIEWRPLARGGRGLRRAPAPAARS